MTAEVKYPFLDLATVNRRYMDDAQAAAADVIQSGRYIGGREVTDFESELAALCHAPYAVAVSNGLDALRLVLSAWVELGTLSDGDKVAVPANTYIASVLAIVHADLQPVFVDPDPITHCMDAKGLTEALSTHPDIRAVMPVHLYGRVAWDSDIKRLVTEKNLLVLEDAAQSIGAIAVTKGLFQSRRAGAIGHAGAFSFYPTKNIGAMGDAGAVVTNSEQLASTVRALANYGESSRYHCEFRGWNCRMDPIQAAILKVKLKDTMPANARRFERAVAYNNVIKNPLVIKPIISPEVTNTVWHQYVVRVVTPHREGLTEFLKQNGVETAIHYPVPPHLQPCFENFGLKGKLPIAEQLAREVLSLPISDCTSVADAAAIGRIINSYKP